jgi:hypothetical protein
VALEEPSVPLDVGKLRHARFIAPSALQVCHWGVLGSVSKEQDSPGEDTLQVDVIVPVANAVVTGAVGLALWWAFRGRFEALEKRMDGLEARMDRLEIRMDRLEGSIRSDFAVLRSDLTMVALAVGAKPRAGDA